MGLNTLNAHFSYLSCLIQLLSICLHRIAKCGLYYVCGTKRTAAQHKLCCKQYALTLLVKY